MSDDVDDVDDVDGPSFEPRSPSRRYIESRRYYGILLLLIVTSIGFGIAASEERWGAYLYFAFQAGTLMLALRASHASSRTFRIAMVLVVIGLIAGTTSALAGSVRTDRIITGAIGAALVLTAIIAIFRELYNHPAVNRRTVSGALCIYLMVGLLFAFLYQFNGSVDPEPFFQDGQDGTASEYLYFSYVTLTTVGFGDLVAAGDTGRMMVVMEAVTGQLYLVTVIGFTVGTFASRARPAERGLATDPDESDTHPPPD